MPSAHEKARLAKKKEAAKKKGGKKAVDEVINLNVLPGPFCSKSLRCEKMTTARREPPWQGLPNLAPTGST